MVCHICSLLMVTRYGVDSSLLDKCPWHLRKKRHNALKQTYYFIRKAFWGVNLTSAEKTTNAFIASSIKVQTLTDFQGMLQAGKHSVQTLHALNDKENCMFFF